MTSTEQY